MKIENRIAKKYRHSVENALATILETGDADHLEYMRAIVESDLLLRVRPVSQVHASGITGLINAVKTNYRLATERLDLKDALAEIHITIAEETIDTGGQRGCEGTFVHEGRHAYDFARTIESFSDADVNPLSLFDPTLYELEWEAHKTSGEWMLRIARDEYIEEGLQLLILGREAEGGCFLNEEGIGSRLRDNYGLTLETNPGPRASELLGLRQR